MSEDDARRALKRLEEQSEKVLGAAPVPAAPEDPVETLGRRIARIVTYALGAFLLYWLWKTYA